MPHAQLSGQTITNSTEAPTEAATTSKPPLLSSQSPTQLLTSSVKLDLIKDPSLKSTRQQQDSGVVQQQQQEEDEQQQQAASETNNNCHNSSQDMDVDKLNLKLCLYGGKEAIVERSFSKDTTLDDVQQEMRKVFDITSDRETKLWINSSVYSFKPTEETVEQSADTKENNSTSKTNNNDNSINSSAPVGKSSPIKPPPTPPPMPKSSSSPGSSSTNANSNSTSPSVVTRQASNWLNKQTPIALPDSTSFVSTSPYSRSSILSISPNSSSNSANKDDSTNGLTQTLSEAGVSDSTIVTLEANNADGTWPSSKPRYGTVTTRSSKAQPGLCGLSNMGNTCFMNSALQCLSNTPPLTNYILTDKFVDDINPDNPLGMHGEIARTYADLIKVMWSGNNSSFLPREFKCAVSRFAPQFTGFAQQDCQELMAFLLDGLHEDLNRIKKKPYIESKTDGERRPDEEVAKESWDNYKKRNDSIVVDTFHARLKSTLICPECQLVSVTFDPFCYLSLPLPVKREKQVNLSFIPAPSKIDESKIKTALKVLESEDVKAIKQFGGRISSFDGTVEEHAGYHEFKNRPRGCKMSVPRSGPASELCEIVARIFNEERTDELPRVKQENLVVAEFSVAVGRVTKIYESNEHYNQISDDIVVIEKASKYVLPLYLKEKRSASDSGHGLSKLLFLHVPDMKYTTLYKSIITSLSNLTTESEEELKSWYKLNPPTEVDEQMDCDEDNGGNGDINIEDGDEITECSNETKTNGNSIDSKATSKTLAFDLSTVNSFGSYSFETLKPNGKDCDYSSKLYLGAAFSTDVASSPQFKHNCGPRNELVDTFTPKVLPKPTLQLKDCITQFTNAERLGADDPWYCPKCKKHQQAIKKFDVWSLPKVLIIHLKRFSFSRSWRDKIDTLVEFPVEGLDMSDYVQDPEQKKQPQLYNLIGVANHFGGLGGGHYTAYAKNAPQNAWYSFDDALVTPISANNVVTRSAYVLFYQLQEENQEAAH